MTDEYVINNLYDSFIQASVVPPWTPGAHINKYCYMKTGALAGNCFKIWDSGTDFLGLILPPAPLVNGAPDYFPAPYGQYWTYGAEWPYSTGWNATAGLWVEKAGGDVAAGYGIWPGWPTIGSTVQFWAKMDSNKYASKLCSARYGWSVVIGGLTLTSSWQQFSVVFDPGDNPKCVSVHVPCDADETVKVSVKNFTGETTMSLVDRGFAIGDHFSIDIGPLCCANFAPLWTVNIGPPWIPGV